MEPASTVPLLRLAGELINKLCPTALLTNSLFLLVLGVWLSMAWSRDWLSVIMLADIENTDVLE